MRLLACAVMVVFLGSGGVARQGVASEAGWAALEEGGQVILMRHALAPGIGDPAAFEREDCATQRNLSDEGRAQAVAIGEALRQRGVRVDAVYSSHWCRVRETAELMALGEVTPVAWLDSFFSAAERHARDERTAQARQRILGWQGPGNLLLVTHQVNVAALVGRGLGSGDMVVVQAGADGLDVIGRLAPSGD